jgi:uncharacterized protein (TIGR00369 family)
MDDAAAYDERQKGFLPDLLGIEWIEVRHGLVKARMAVTAHHMAPNGYLHGGAIVTLADTACGFGAMSARPPEAIGFTTIELKANFLGTARQGAAACTARLVHGGRQTQVWDAEVSDEAGGKIIALFRCTQMMLYPKAAAPGGP